MSSYQDKVLAIQSRLEAIKIIPVLAACDPVVAPKLAETLINNGLPCIEVTFRSETAIEVIKAIRTACPDMMLGSGTVLTKEHVDISIELGVDFAVSPGFNPDIVNYAKSKGLPFIPGVNNPSHVEQAMSLGINTLKFFPADVSGGPGMLKALGAVYPVKFMPTGGVKLTNVADYLKLSNVFCCGGTWMIPKDLIEQQNWEELGKLTRAAALIS